jgi:hypothetical protein
MAVLVTSTGEQKLVIPANKEKFTLAELQHLVGGCIEVFRTDEKEFILNENGRNLNLPKNEVATAMLYAELIGFKPISYLVGDVLICEPFERN